ncbi:hypothetical protein [Pseudomonas sp. BN102]|uniref:hypothetical protein n=1 Tax=Pseudomonas sp. BN102 TaxID=2567886 RepID=UPI002458B586|nr:hypothetical protein [Pseudomonas sp. BN102]MDH4608117.1 hypothetical protein [Pseudomonas sp. BN102]
MLDLLLLTVLAAALIVPPVMLYRRAEQMSWTTRYTLSALPAAYTWAGWKLSELGYVQLGCQGGLKYLHACFADGLDLTPLVGHGFLMMIPFVFVAAPLSAWFLLDTALKQIGDWNRRG